MRADTIEAAQDAEMAEAAQRFRSSGYHSQADDDE